MTSKTAKGLAGLKAENRKANREPHHQGAYILSWESAAMMPHLNIYLANWETRCDFVGDPNMFKTGQSYIDGNRQYDIKTMQNLP